MVPEGGVFREKFARGFLETGAWFHHQNKRRFVPVVDCWFFRFFRIFVAVDVGFSLEMFGGIKSSNVHKTCHKNIRCRWI